MKSAYFVGSLEQISALAPREDIMSFKEYLAFSTLPVEGINSFWHQKLKKVPQQEWRALRTLEGSHKKKFSNRAQGTH